LERLAGLIKYVIKHKAGQTSISELAAACAQGEYIVHKSLDWLVLQNQVKVEFVAHDQIVITDLKGGSQNEASDKLLDEIKLLLQETSAYRLHFYKADQWVLLN
jgi:hypothetical protein